jgi:4-hydroxy-2-oxoheptanedioate aldolase
MNLVKDMLKSGKTVIGAGANIRSDTDFLANSGFDFLQFDTQHTPVEIKALGPQLANMRGGQAIPIVRVGDNHQDQVCYALDIGAKGINIPLMVCAALGVCAENGASMRPTATTWML